MSEHLTISHLLLQARGGDRAALEHLFRASRPYLQLLAHSRLESQLQDKFDGSDLVQQTLLEAYQGFAGFGGGTEAEWLGWLRRILAHNAADFIRDYRCGKRCVRAEVRLHHVGDTSVGELLLSAGGESPSQELLRKEQELRVVEALAQLSPEHRQVVLLRNLERLPFNQVAERMGRSRPAVQMLWVRALVKLQEALA